MTDLTEATAIVNQATQNLAQANTEAERDQMIQQIDLDAREWSLLKALQKIDRAGFHDEALLFAFEGGVLEQFRKDIQRKETSNAENR